MIQAFKILMYQIISEGPGMVRQARVGERAIIDRIVRTLHKQPGMPIPFGDDISAMDLGWDKLAILKCDMLVGRTDVPKGMTLRQAARKAVVMNVSDFACKGVQPRAIMVSLGLPRSITAQNVQEIARGLDEGAREYDTYVIGGDTSECDDLVIGCYLFGVAKRNRIVRRSGAGPNDVIAVTGEFGKTSAALRLLSSGLAVPRSLRRVLLESIYLPKARLTEGMALARARVTTASMDSSDGLAWSLYEIARGSGVGIELEEVPIAQSAIDYARKADLDPLDLALYGGEEYELVMSLKKNAYRKALRVAPSLHVVGKVTRKKGMVTLARDGERTLIKPVGWEHFKSSLPYP
jgi:thiamine-monophosphate kinase